MPVELLMQIREAAGSPAPLPDDRILPVWVLNTPNHGAKLSSVNNVSGNHI